MASALSLRDVQRDGLDAIREAVASGQRRILGVAPTGFGKTILFSHVRAHLRFPEDAKVLILVHRDELAQQAVEKYQACTPGTIIGIEKGDAHAAPMDSVVVASVQSLKGKRLQDFARRWGVPVLVITDEAHHATAPSYQAIYTFFGITPTGGIVHIGVTATPKHDDNIELEAVFDVIAFSFTLAEIIERGYLVPLVGYRVETTTSLDAVHTLAGDFNERELADAVDNPIRNARVVSAYRDITPGRRALVFAASVAHSMNLREMFERAGYRAAHIDGTTPMLDRRELLKAYGRGEYDVMCNCAVLTEGYDEPAIEVVIIARPTKSGALYAQMIGRGARLNEGKTKCAVIDIVDATKKHSVVSLPTLLGLPATMDLKGRSATAAARKYERMVKESPLAAMLIKNVKTLESLDSVQADARLAFLVKELLDGAKRTQQYVSVDLLKPPPMPVEASAASMAWVATGNDQYMLAMSRGAESVIVQQDVLGHYTVDHRENGNRSTIGQFPALLPALRAGESWVRANREQQVGLLAKAPWRRDPASDKQLAALKRFRIECPPNMTKGEASAALDIATAAVARGDMHARK